MVRIFNLRCHADIEGCIGAGEREHNCCMLCKAGINENATSGSEDNPSAKLLERMRELQYIQLAPTTVTPDEWVNSDADVETSAAITDEDII